MAKLNEMKAVEVELEGAAPENEGEGSVFRNEIDRKAAVQYLQSEIDAVKNLKSDRTARIDKWKRASQLTPEQRTKDFPWKNASNLVSYITLTNVNGMTSALKGAYDQKKPFYHVEPNDVADRDKAEALERYLDLLVNSERHINLKELRNEMFYEVACIGTKMCLVGWDKDVYTYIRSAFPGDREKIETVRHIGPIVIPIRDEDFFIPEYATTLMNAPWFAIKHNLTWHELKRREVQGWYHDIDKIKGNTVRVEDENAERDRQRSGVDTGEASDLYEIMEANVFWDVERDGELVDVKIWFEKTSGQVIREEFNSLGTRNVATGYYFKIPGKFYGLGVGQICEQAQDGTDALTNMAINSTHISSLQGFATKRGSNIGPNFKFRPLFQLEVDVPREDIQTITFPNTIGPNMSMIGMIRNDVDRGVGANNALLGFPDTVAKSRTTASGYMFQAQQSSRAFNAVVENTDMWLAEIITLVVYQLAQHKDEADFSLTGPEDERLLREIFDLPPEKIMTRFGFSIKTTDIEETEEARRQQVLTLSQLYTMFAKNILGLQQSEIQLLMPFAQQFPDVMPKIQEALVQYIDFSNQFKVGANSLMKDILKYFDVKAEDKLPNTKKIAMMLEYMNAIQDIQLGGMANVLQNGMRTVEAQGVGPQGPGGPMGGPGPEGAAGIENKAGSPGGPV